MLNRKGSIWHIVLLFTLLLLPLSSIYGMSESTKVSGQVVDINGEPLPGVIVSIIGSTTNGTQTNIDGEFSLSLTTGQSIRFSYIGFKTQEIVWEGQSPLEITMHEDSELLDELVVVGYGVQKKVNLSGAVDQIDQRDLERKPIMDISKGLQGMIPNLNIDFGSGEPGQSAQINIRGAASINGSSPLILIDGIPSSVSDMSRILPADIESISVIKDSSSAAIYGARAAFGVILITTKSGSSGRPRISYSGKVTWKKPTILPEKTSDPYIYLKLKNIAVLNTPWSGGHVISDETLEWARQKSDDPSIDPVRPNPQDPTLYEYMGDKDWTKYFIDKTTLAHSHQLSISGGSDKYRYYSSVGLDMDNGLLSNIVEKDRWRRLNLRVKGEYKLAPWATISNNTTYIYSSREKPSYFWNSDMGMFYNLSPQDYHVNPDGTWANNGAGRTLAQLVDGGMDIRQNNRFQTIFAGKFEVIKDILTINADYSYLKDFQDYNWHQTPYQIGFGPNDIRTEGSSSAYRTFTPTSAHVYDLFGNFFYTIGKHNITALLGFNQESHRYNWVKAEREGLISESFPTIQLATGEAQVAESIEEWAVRGLFYRLNYSYDDKYIIEVNGRYDGSSRFPKESRFGFFPSVSLAWRIDREKFFSKASEHINLFKLRGSYGSLGNQSVSAYGYIPTMPTYRSSYIIGGTLPTTIGSANLVSPNYTWETVTTSNIGIDLGLLQNRISFSADAYTRNTYGMLTAGEKLPGVLGAPSPRENAADMITRGWEVTFGYQDTWQLGGKDLHVYGKLSVSDNLSRITKFNNPTKDLTQYYEGQILGEIWGLESDGLFRTQEEIDALDESELIPWGALSIVPGWPKYIDQNNDQRITKSGATADNPMDLKIIGNNHPRYRFGINLGGDWNGIDFSLFLQGVGKRDYYPLSYLYWSFYQQPYAGGAVHTFDFYRPSSDSETDRLKHSQSYLENGLDKENLDSFYPILQCWLADKNLGTSIDKSAGLAIPQTRYLLNAAYLRIKNITLGYTLPQEWSQKIHMSKLHLYISADNAFEWSGVKKYFDPEAITNESSYGYVYPFDRRLTIGLDVTF